MKKSRRNTKKPGKKNINIGFNDGLIVTGWLVVLAGIWLIYQPAAYIVAGLSIFYMGWVGGDKKADENKKTGE